MTENEKEIVSSFLENFVDGNLISDCGIHEPADIFNGLVLFRCEILPQFSRLVNNFALEPCIIILLGKEAIFHEKFLPNYNNYNEKMMDISDEYCLAD